DFKRAPTCAWRRRYQQGDLPVLRHVLLYAGGEIGHWQDLEVGDGARHGSEDKRRFATGSDRRNAIGRVEDQDLSPEVVRRRSYFRRHRTRRGGSNTDSVDARFGRHHDGWTLGASAPGQLRQPSVDGCAALQGSGGKDS